MAEKKKKKLSTHAVVNYTDGIKVENDIPVLERIRYPIIWERIATGYRVQDLQLSKVDNAIELIKDYFIKEETLCKGVRLADDIEAVDEYLELVTHWLRDTQSLAVVEEGTGIIVGLLIGRVLDKSVRAQSRIMINESFIDPDKVDEKVCVPSCEQSERLPLAPKKNTIGKSKNQLNSASRVSNTKKNIKLSEKDILNFVENAKQRVLLPMFDDEHTIVKNETLQAIQKFKSYLTRKIDILNIYNIETYYSVYIIFVLPEHRNRGIGKALIQSTIEMSKKYGCDVVSGIFTSPIAQNITHKQGFKVHEEFYLKNWLDDKDKPVFAALNEDCHSAAVMAFKWALPQPRPSTPPTHPPRKKTMKL